MIDFIFFSAFLLIFFAYLGYPLLLLLQARLLPKPVQKAQPGTFTPSVSVIIAARNEEHVIGKRIQNLLDQDYPSELMEIIVVSDGSEDGTEEIVRRMAAQSSTVRLGISPRPQGKPHALNEGVILARGDLLVFADCRQTFKPDAVKNLAANFADSAVGCVSGELVFVETPGSSIQAEMGAYWKYEKLVRKCESRSGSVVGATGAIYAIRKALYKPLPMETLLDDVLTPLNIAFQGQRVVFDSSAVAYDVVSKNGAQEWRRKVRTLAGNWQLINLCPGVLNPGHNPLWWRLVGHKFLRLLVPLALPALFLSSIMLGGAGYLFASLQGLFYGLAGIGFWLEPARKFRLVNLSYFFLVLNGAALVGLIRWMTGRCAGSWQPR